MRWPASASAANRSATWQPSTPARAAANAANARAADAFAARTLPIIDAIKAAGFTSLRAIAGELTRREVPTARGGAWSADAVRAVLLRA